MSRIEGWEKRLAEIVARAKAKPYQLGVHDCFSFSCEVCRSLTGRDVWQEFAGRYASTEEAIALIYSRGKNYTEAFTWAWSSPPISPKLAQRGDIVARTGEDGYMHLGVCLGLDSAYLGPEGLVMLRTIESEVAWRIE